MSRGPRVTIAGAGVLGLTSALALADAGCEVTVRDPGGPNASSVAAGMLAPVFEAVLDGAVRPHLDLLLAARDLWPSLAARTGIGLDRSGALAVGEAAWMERVLAGFAAVQMRPTELSGASARRMAPGLSEAFGAAFLSREDWRVDAPSAVRALAAAAAEASVTFEAGRVLALTEADILVVATGADPALAQLAPELRSLAPIKGHIVRLAAPSGGAVVRGERVYAAPGPGMVFGATMEAGQDDSAVDTRMAEPLLAAGLELFPRLRGASVRIEAGVRAATPDGLPMVGPVGEGGVILATGARRNGWLLAPLVARMVTAWATGADPGPHAARLDPTRFPAPASPTPA